MSEELRRIEARLAGRLPADERSSLEYEAQLLRQSIRAAEAGREQAQESLATTPMVFNYGSGELVPGFADDLTLSKAWQRALDNLSAAGLGLMIILVTLGALGPARFAALVGGGPYPPPLVPQARAGNS